MKRIFAFLIVFFFVFSTTGFCFAAENDRLTESLNSATTTKVEDKVKNDDKIVTKKFDKKKVFKKSIKKKNFKKDEKKEKDQSANLS